MERKKVMETLEMNGYPKSFVRRVEERKAMSRRRMLKRVKSLVVSAICAWFE